MTHFISLGGYTETGKDAFADMLAELPTWRKRRMSEPFEVGLLACNPWINLTDDDPIRIQFGWPQFLRYSAIHTSIGYERSKKIPEVRRFTQKFATEAGRDIHGESCWTDIAAQSCTKDRAEGFNVALTGIRFHKEIDMVSDLGGISIWVERPGYGPVNDHSSDNTLGPDDFDYILANDGTLQDLAGHAIALAALLGGEYEEEEFGTPILLSSALPKMRLP